MATWLAARGRFPLGDVALQSGSLLPDAADRDFGKAAVQNWLA